MPISEILLDWYDRHARDLPWRTGPYARRRGEAPDPYRVWLSEIMLQQTTVAAVKDYFRAFTERWPTVEELAAAPDEEVMAAWAGLGYYARARNLLKCARIIAAEHGGRFPDSREALLDLPGIGPYTASAIASIAFDAPETVVDGNVERVMARLHDIHEPLPTAKTALTKRAAHHTPKVRAGDYAQAVMDLGATICTPRNPACGICPLREPCAARINGTAAELPRKMPKKPKPIRRGIVFVAMREDGAFLLETRPPEGLLGGMLGWPGTGWSEEGPFDPSPPVHARWSNPGLEARHTFTHFHLRLAIRLARVPMDAVPAIGRFIPREEFRPSNLPTLMRKVFDLSDATLRDLESEPRLR